MYVYKTILMYVYINKFTNVCINILYIYTPIEAEVPLIWSHLKVVTSQDLASEKYHSFQGTDPGWKGTGETRVGGCG
jgi:hypothetical protein